MCQPCFRVCAVYNAWAGSSNGHGTGHWSGQGLHAAPVLDQPCNCLWGQFRLGSRLSAHTRDTRKSQSDGALHAAHALDKLPCAMCSIGSSLHTPCSVHPGLVRPACRVRGWIGYVCCMQNKGPSCIVYCMKCPAELVLCSGSGMAGSGLVLVWHGSCMQCTL